MFELIDLLLVSSGPYSVGESVSVPLVAYASPAVRMNAADIIIKWDNTVLCFDGIDNSTNTLPALMSFLPAPKGWYGDLSGINEVIPPADGDALYYWLSPLCGCATMVDGFDTMTVFKFTVLQPFASTSVEFIPALTYTSYPEETIVWGSNVGGWPVTGSTTSATITGSPFDLDGDLFVGPVDLSLVLTHWNQFGTQYLAGVLGNWGPCR